MDVLDIFKKLNGKHFGPVTYDFMVCIYNSSKLIGMGNVRKLF